METVQLYSDFILADPSGTFFLDHQLHTPAFAASLENFYYLEVGLLMSLQTFMNLTKHPSSGSDLSPYHWANANSTLISNSCQLDITTSTDCL